MNRTQKKLKFIRSKNSFRIHGYLGKNMTITTRSGTWPIKVGDVIWKNKQNFQCYKEFWEEAEF